MLNQKINSNNESYLDHFENCEEVTPSPFNQMEIHQFQSLNRGRERREASSMHARKPTAYA